MIKRGDQEEMGRARASRKSETYPGVFKKGGSHAGCTFVYWVLHLNSATILACLPAHSPSCELLSLVKLRRCPGILRACAYAGLCELTGKLQA